MGYLLPNAKPESYSVSVTAVESSGSFQADSYLETKEKRSYPSFPVLGASSNASSRADTGRSFWERHTQCLGRSQSQVGWKPATLRLPILGSFIFVSLAIIILLEVLSSISANVENGGGIAFASTSEGISSANTFGYLYLPTVLAVTYSMMWSWVDLDTKRLEPWFQLSKEGGVTAAESLLLQYPFDFLPFVPFSAARRRHWGVFYAGTVMILIFWIVTPLQSAIFNTGTVTRLHTAAMATSGTLVPGDQQTGALNSNFLNLAYGVSWLNQTLPPFTTSEVAFLPFTIASETGSSLSTESWSTTVESFYTNLTCSPAEVVMEPTFTYSFSNGKGCTVPGIALIDTPGIGIYSMSYIGYYDNPQSDWALQNPKCSAEFSNNFLAIWASAESRFEHGRFHNITALFCETSYSLEEMHVAVNASGHAVHSVRPAITSKNISSVDKVFNTTNFEYLLATSVPASGQKSNLPDTSVLQQYSRMKDFGLTWPVSNMVGFAAALSNTSIDSLAEPSALQDAFQRAHQLLFVAAFHTMTINSSASSSNVTQSTRPGIRQDRQEAIILVRSISIVVEIALGVIIALTLALWYHSRYRSSYLNFDPASLSDVMSMAPHTTIFDSTKHDETLTNKVLETALSQKVFRLSNITGGAPFIVQVIVQAPGQNSAAADGSPMLGSVSENTSKAVQPLELRTFTGITFIGLLSAALGGVVFLEIWTSNHNGISISDDSPFVRSIIENYAPTALATLLEPAWTLLNRLLCLLQPFEELRRGKARPAASVLAKYTSLPPQLAIWRALRARHLILAAVCFITVSTNVLAVALSALLEERPTTIVIPFETLQRLSPKFNGTPIFDNAILSGPGSYLDHFYITSSNISSGTALPPWIDSQFFYLPFDVKAATTEQNRDMELQGLSGKTTGFGTNITCVEITAEDNSLRFDVNSNGSSVQFSTTTRLPNGTDITCVLPLSDHFANDTTHNLMPFSNGHLALEAVQGLQPLTNSTDGGLCASTMTMGWARVKSEIGDIGASREVTTTFLSCTPKLLVADFDVVVDQTGRIIHSNRTSDFALDTGSYFSSDVTINDTAVVPIRSETDLFQGSTALIAAPNVNGFNWHNDSFTSDWMNSLLNMVQNSTNLADPATPLPNMAFIGPLAEKLYSQLFCILLGLNTHVFLAPPTPLPFEAQVSLTESRLFVSPIMFKLTTIILSLHLLVAILYYTRRPVRFLPRMPTSIASVLAFAAASRAADEFRDGSGKRVRDEQRYGYGHFIGTDGKTHVGIEQQRFVVRLESRNPEVRRRNWSWRQIPRTRTEPKSWI